MVSQKREAERLRLAIRGGWLKIADAVALAERGVCGTVGEARERLLAFLRQHSTREA